MVIKLLNAMIFLLLFSQTLTSAVSDLLTPIGTPQKRKAIKPACEPVINSDDVSTLGEFVIYLDGAYGRLCGRNSLGLNELDRNNIERAFDQHVRQILAKVNAEECFHPTPLAAISVERHLRGIDGLSVPQFKMCGARKYLEDTASPYAKVSTTPHGNHVVDTGEWNSLSALLHVAPGKSFNFIEALWGRSPASPSGTCDLHHVYQTEGVITRLPKALHQGHYAKLHPAKHLPSSIDRKRFDRERGAINNHWALETALVVVSDLLIAHKRLIDIDTVSGVTVLALVQKYASVSSGDINRKSKVVESASPSDCAKVLDFYDDNYVDAAESDLQSSGASEHNDLSLRGLRVEASPFVPNYDVAAHTYVAAPSQLYGYTPPTQSQANGTNAMMMTLAQQYAASVLAAQNYATAYNYYYNQALSAQLVQQMGAYQAQMYHYLQQPMVRVAVACH